MAPDEQYKARFDVNMSIKSLIILSDTECVQSEGCSSSKTTKYCRGADRAPQITASFTRDRRRAHMAHLLVGEAWTGPNRCPNGHESAVRVQT